jgi:hypothetical protein
MKARIHLLWKIAGAVFCLYAFYALWALWPCSLPEGVAEYEGFIRSMHPRRVYWDSSCIVVVQVQAGGVEYGKYIVPDESSHYPFGGDYILGPTTYHISGQKGLGAAVYDYRKGQPPSAADLRKPFRLETNLMPSVAGSRR